MTKSMLSQVVSRIADQFDAVQASLDEAVAGRAEDLAQTMQALQTLHASLAELRTWTQEQASSTKQEVDKLAESQEAARQREEQMSASIGALRERLAAHTAEAAGLQGAVQDQGARLNDLEATQKAAEAREAGSSQLMQEALTVWQHGVEAQLQELDGKLDQYKAYVGRLRREVRELGDERDGTHAVLMAALGKEMAGLGGGVALLQRDAAGLLSDLQSGREGIKD